MDSRWEFVVAVAFIGLTASASNYTWTGNGGDGELYMLEGTAPGTVPVIR